jgi:HSP20 family molecular chaperone IbpA
MALPEEVNVDDAEASLENGVLELVLPKKVPKKKVPIK